MDIFPVANPSAPLHIFVHGGYWRARDKADYSFVADALAPHGISTIVINYDLCPEVQVSDIVEQVKRAFSRSEEHTSELQSLMRISYAVFCLNKKTIRKLIKY